MSKPGKVIIAIIVVAVIVGGALLLMGDKPDTPTSTPSNTNQNEEKSEETVAVTITYFDNGFSVPEDTVKSGDKIKFVNKSQKEIEPASDPHPVHTDNPELNAGDIEPGGSKTLTLTTKGTWGFHNHYNPTNAGRITVE